ncbi:MAG: 3-deoxy-8-phosphooctulonate synthase [bacterium]|nr:MAG: 3-deoxy-8-phosphooctulonate synthase [bacterium]
MVKINKLKIAKDQPLTVIAGPCVIEGKKIIFQTVERLKQISEKYGVQFIFKSSFRKANRTSLEGFTGLDFNEALGILTEVRDVYDVPVLTDVHTELEVPVVAEVADVLQIPAFLCRQTDLLLAAGRTGKAVNIKKGQFVAPEDMIHAVKKVSSTGNQNILVTERGASFGYRNLVVDMRSLVMMEKFGYPVVYDATHSVQVPGGLGAASGGQPEFILPLARAALATGALSAVFMEVHPNPSQALSDAASQLKLDEYEKVLEQLISLHQLLRKFN